MSKRKHLEEWLDILLKTHAVHPSKALAKTIEYYVSKLLKYDEMFAVPPLKSDLFK